jgi:hypothetical protein
MALQFTTAEAASSVGGVKLLVYGGAGMGKTVMAATCPGPIVLSAESGLLSLRKANLERLFGVGNPNICYDIPVIKITNVDDLSAAYQWLTTSARSHNIRTAYIDSLTEIGEVVLNNAKRQVKDPRQAYGELIEKMETLIRAFRDLPGMNVVMTAKMEPMKDELTGVVKYGPAMPGAKLAQKLPYFFDEVFRLGVNKTPAGESYRFLQTQPEMQYEAKDRSGALAAMEPPHLTQIFNKILGA